MQYVKINEYANVIDEVKALKKKNNAFLIYIALIDNSDDYKMINNFYADKGISLDGVIFDEKMFSCRHESVRDKVRAFSNDLDIKKISLEELSKRSQENQVIVVSKIDILYFTKINKVLEENKVNCISHHLNEYKYNFPVVGENALLPSEGQCCGCGVCSEVCPHKAISMQYSRRGFIIPVVDGDKCVKCNACSNICPSLNPKFTNSFTPDFYSVAATDDIRKVSSSGGMFTLLADYTFSNGGYVCGAMFNENMQLKHAIIDNIKDINRMRGSKYLQSNITEVLKPIRDLLNNDKTVLFVGTPCQVAAVKSYLRRDYDKLITADLLCHGTPSPMFFEKYLTEKTAPDNIDNVFFRKKQYGWNLSTLHIACKDNTDIVNKKNSASNPDPYLNAFSKQLMNRDICHDCLFQNYPRQGDFTIGDLWHSDELDPGANDKKGLSFVFANNEKAKNIFSAVKEKAKYYNRLYVKNYDKIPNRVGSKSWVNPKKDRFLSLLRYKSFSEAYDYTVEEKYDIGMACVLRSSNIGSVLTSYALYRYLSDKGLSVLPIERPLESSLGEDDKAKAFCEKWIESYSQPVLYKTSDDMWELNRKCNAFIVGSDQVFMQSMNEARNNMFFLQWTEESKYKMAVSTSYGGPGARGTKDYNRKMKYFLDRFSFVSCREDNGVDFANNELDLKNNVKWCIDPVFLCNKEYYMQLIRSVDKKRTKKYIASYILKPRKIMQNIINRVMSVFPDLDIEIAASEAVQNSDKVKLPVEPTDSFPIEETLEKIYNCDYFVTDSFHGVCFAVLFRKNFICCPRDFRDRFDSILGRIGLSDKIVTSSDFDPKLFEDINYDEVYKKLDVIIKNCDNMISDELNGIGKNAPMTDMDHIMELLHNHNKAIAEMQEMLSSLQGNV